MNRRTVLWLTAVCFLASGSVVRADTINVSDLTWGYHFMPDGKSFNIVTSNNALGIVNVAGTGGSLYDMHTAPGATMQISTPIHSWSSASALNPQSVWSMPFSVNLQLVDRPSNVSEYVSFGGVLNGNIWKTGSTLSPLFLSPLAQTVNIDHHLYTVRFSSFKAPQGPSHPGSFTFDVTVKHNPEPSALVLAGIGVPLFGLILRRRQRASALAA